MSDEKLDRRNFFRLGVHKVAKAAVGVAEAKISQRARRYIRPPFAIEEFDFLVKCSRCGDCIEACPHGTVFPLTARLGVDLLNTPALDLTHGACQMCEDWPCVTACKEAALKLATVETDEDGDKDRVEGKPLPMPALPRLATARVNQTTCLAYMGPECGACGSVCPVPGAIIWDMTRPQINKDICTGCAICRQACITEPKAINLTPI
jgi:ferredoxin-type protein NapG